MTKDKINRADLAMYQEAMREGGQSATGGFDDHTAACDACGEEHVGVGTAVMMAMPGMVFPSMEYDVPVFVPDPDVQLRMITLPNGMIGFVTDETKTKYLHEECYQEVIDLVAYDTLNSEIDEDEDEEDEEEVE